jgi:hypothetical protein
MTTLDAVKAALYTALWTFIGLFAVSLLGLVQQVAQWASSSGHTPLPGLSVVGYAVVSAFTAAASGLVAFVVRYAQTKGLTAPGVQPVTYTPPASG